MTDDAMQIRALVSRWADAVHAGDLDIVALALLVVAAVIAWARRSSNSILVDILRR